MTIVPQQQHRSFERKHRSRHDRLMSSKDTVVMVCVCIIFLALCYFLTIPKFNDNVSKFRGASKYKNDDNDDKRQRSNTNNNSSQDVVIRSGKLHLQKALSTSPRHSDDTHMDYLYCRSSSSQQQHHPFHTNGHTLMNLLLLHGASFTHNDWEEKSRILSRLCSNSSSSSVATVIALDFNVQNSGLDLYYTIHALWDDTTLQLENHDGSKAVVVISPSASGKSVLELATLKNSGSNSEQSNDDPLLPHVVKAWVTIASYAVLSTATTLLESLSNNIPILAIHGSKDTRGKQVTERLQQYCHAKTAEMDGASHPAYLEKPEEFVQLLQLFLENDVL